MKKNRMLLPLLILLNLAIPAWAQQADVKNLTATQYQREFNHLVSQGYRPVKVFAKTLSVIDYQPGERPQLGYWGTFEKRPGTAWVARHGLSHDAYQREFTTWTQQGYMPTDINVAFMNGHTSYCVIFDKIPNQPAWVARHGLNQADFTKANNDLIQQRYIRTITTSCPAPSNRVYAGLWIKR